MRFPSSRFVGSVVSDTALWTSSIAPVCNVSGAVQQRQVLTMMIGHLSLAEIYANEVLSAVDDRAYAVSLSTLLRCKRLRVFVSYSILFLLIRLDRALDS